MWLAFVIGSAVGGAIAAFLVRRHFVRAREAAIAHVTGQLGAASAECERLRAEQQALLAAISGELRTLDGALATAPDAKVQRLDGQVRRDQQARAQLALVSRGSEALEQFVAGVLYRGEEATRSAEEARRVAGEAAEHAERVERAGALLAALGREFDAVRETMEGLARAGSQIGTFVQTIEGIASQTNLLALNAAIEAARAGAHGRGFAVVADEVRKLADDASRAARQVSESVQAIRGAIEQVGTVVGSADAGLAGVRDVTVDAQRALTGVVEGLGRTVAFVEQVAASVSGESAALDGLLSDMGEIHQQASTALAQATRSAEEGAARDEALARVVDVAGRVRGVTTRFAAGVGA